MAKKLGADAPPKVGKKGAGAPPPGTNQVVTQEMFLQAVKEIGAEQAKVKAARDALKAVRLQWKGAGVQMGIMDAAVKMAEWSRGEIRDHFNHVSNYAMWLGMPVAPAASRAKVGMSDDEHQRSEWFALGRTYSRTGKPPRPPEECPDEFHQAFMAGFNEEDEAAWMDADGAEQAEVEEPEPSAPETTLAEAAAAAIVADTPAPAPEPAQEASEPVAEAQGSTEFAQLSWKGYSEDPEDWFAAQWKEFDAWYASIPEGATVRISHKGVRTAFQSKEKAAEATDAAGDEGALDEVDEEVDAYGQGYAACKADKQREAPETLSDVDADKWLVGWDVRAKEEMDKKSMGAPPPPAKGRKAAAKKAVH